MPKTITIEVPDAAYDAMRAEAERTRRTPEQLATALIAQQFGAPEKTPEQRAREHLIAYMRSQGDLIDWHTDKTTPAPAFKPFDENLADELSDALEQSGLNILDLIERR